MTIDDSLLTEEQKAEIAEEVRRYRRKQHICLFLFVILILGLFGNRIWDFWSGVWNNWEWPVYPEGSAGSDFFKWSAKWFK